VEFTIPQAITRYDWRIKKIHEIVMNRISFIITFFAALFDIRRKSRYFTG